MLGLGEVGDGTPGFRVLMDAPARLEVGPGLFGLNEGQPVPRRVPGARSAGLMLPMALEVILVSASTRAAIRTLPHQSAWRRPCG